MKRPNWWLILLIILCVVWFVVLPVVQLAIGITNRERIGRLERRGSVEIVERHTYHLDITIPSFIYDLADLERTTAVNLRGVLIDSTVELTVGVEDTTLAVKEEE